MSMFKHTIVNFVLFRITKGFLRLGESGTIEFKVFTAKQVKCTTNTSREITI